MMAPRPNWRSMEAMAASMALPRSSLGTGAPDSGGVRRDMVRTSLWKLFSGNGPGSDTPSQQLERRHDGEGLDAIAVSREPQGAMGDPGGAGDGDVDRSDGLLGRSAARA